MRKNIVILGAIAVLVALARDGAHAAATEGCCQFKSKDIFAFFGLPPILFCENLESNGCPDDEGDPFGQDHVFIPGKVCGSLGQCSDPPGQGKITTTSKIADSPEDCGTDAAQRVVLTTTGRELTDCLEICNDTPNSLTNFTLIVNGIPEFSNLSSLLPPGACTFARPRFTAQRIDSSLVMTRTAEWEADFVPSGWPVAGGASGGAPDVTETQQAFAIIQPGTTAPTAGAHGIGALGLGLFAYGIRRLARR